MTDSALLTSAADFVRCWTCGGRIDRRAMRPWVAAQFCSSRCRMLERANEVTVRNEHFIEKRREARGEETIRDGRLT